MARNKSASIPYKNLQPAITCQVSPDVFHYVLLVYPRFIQVKHQTLNFKHKLKLGYKSFTKQTNDENIFPVQILNTSGTAYPSLIQLGACSKFFTWNDKQHPVNMTSGLWPFC
jgi:hypothetical protein